MDINTLFELANAAAGIGWLLLIAFPQTKITRIFVRSGFLILLFAAVYSVMIFGLFNAEMFGDFSTLEGVMGLFSDPVGVTVGWIHYLAFDLFVGLWITTEAQKIGFNRWLLLPCQLMTFMFGPLGLLVFFGLRIVQTKYLAPTPMENS